MNSKPYLRLSPLCLCLLAGVARADLEPYSFGATETIQHQSNINRTADEQSGDWVSGTEVRGAVDQTLGRERVQATAAVDLNRYKEFKERNSTSYAAKGEFDWSTIGDLSGALGADSRRRNYFYGFDGETLSDAKNMQSDNHVFARAQLGGVGRWTIFTGFDANHRDYSEATFKANEERQWSWNGGTSYATSPDLQFGVTGQYVRGEYPHFDVGGGKSQFSLRSIDLTTKWQVSAATSLNATAGYTSQHSDQQPDNNYFNGSLDWTWTPPSRFRVQLGLVRDSNSDTGQGGIVTTNISGRSINNVAHLEVGYELSSRISLDASARYTDRDYSNAILPAGETSTPARLNGHNRTTQVGLRARYQVSRIADLSCGFSREVRRADASAARLTPGYTNNTTDCAASVNFD